MISGANSVDTQMTSLRCGTMMSTANLEFLVSLRVSLWHLMAIWHVWTAEHHNFVEYRGILDALPVIAQFLLPARIVWVQF